MKEREGEREREKKRQRERERERERQRESESEQRYEHMPTLPVSLEPTSGQELLRCFLSIDLGYKVPACFGLIRWARVWGIQDPVTQG